MSNVTTHEIESFIAQAFSAAQEHVDGMEADDVVAELEFAIDELDEEPIQSVRTFGEVMMLTNDAGLQVEVGGKRFNITVQEAY